MGEIKTVAVLGAGTMGHGITQVTAAAGYAVVIQDIAEPALEAGLKNIKKSLAKLVVKGKISQEEETAVCARITATTSLDEAVKDADLVIEAVPENLELKLSTFRRLDAACKPGAIIGSNTSTLPITSLAAVTKRPQQVCGIHFMNPVPVMTGVEVIKGRLTSQEVMAAVEGYLRRIGKEPVMAVDYAGFIVSRLLDVLINEAFKCVMDGNSPEEIDKAMKLCCNFPIGPLALCDLVGADIVLHGLETLERDLGDKYKAAPLLRQMVRAGELGRKTGRGIYSYAE